MSQWVIPVTVDVWVEAETLEEAVVEITFDPPSVDVIGSAASYISSEVVTFGEPVLVLRKPQWANQR